ncbi:dTDP-4-dehydrorhamnose 3,5-epimerase family protein [Candidatus Contubernalis alkaliaceticus]|uniref:dTDP-4-dehydrorhamnose 3,5-epimerase family protein n=1 Tax=Candidatus Contubernalis alkaliaceticus TaxID=338645 RepID=UPI001F4BD106|nr:dTDP-4-dehydrorhamnose 3,5-epimerase family protein [Candidatus Contubernalis alkalaceticus]UNC93634.1 dTDP-4-dehydrorhamnose 3,5-epimerase family protein [Candidatus Contubernalis alkalaceticus]
MIEGVVITPLKQFLDERGKVMHMFRCDSDNFEQFGEIYFSCVYPGAIKGWHIHKLMTLNYAVPTGNIKLVLYDNREDSATRGELQEIFLGPDNYCLVTIPPLVWNGFKGIGTEMAVVANCSSIPHDPEEIDRLDPFDASIPYNWDIKHQ